MMNEALLKAETKRVKSFALHSIDGVDWTKSMKLTEGQHNSLRELSRMIDELESSQLKAEQLAIDIEDVDMEVPEGLESAIDQADEIGYLGSEILSYVLLFEQYPSSDGADENSEFGELEGRIKAVTL